MSGKESKKKKKVPEVLSWKQKQERADKDEEAVKKEVEELISWTKMIETMNDEQLKEYLLNRPKSLQSAKTAKSAPSKMAKRAVKPRASSSRGIMASVWKFHKEEDEEAAVSPSLKFDICSIFCSQLEKYKGVFYVFHRDSFMFKHDIAF